MTDLTLASTIQGALAVLASWTRACSPRVLAALSEAIEAGAEPALVVTATHAGTPEMHIAARTPEGVVVLVARVLTEAPAGEPLQ